MGESFFRPSQSRVLRAGVIMYLLFAVAGITAALFGFVKWQQAGGIFVTTIMFLYFYRVWNKVKDAESSSGMKKK